ncbi:hypothetical protein Tco_1076886 [Tanacetum coccineum]
MMKTGLVEAIDSLVPLDEHLATFRGIGYSRKGRKQSQNDKTEHENKKSMKRSQKSKPKSIPTKLKSKEKSKQSQNTTLGTEFAKSLKLDFKDLKTKVVQVNSGCSRSMTGNKEKLDDFVKIIGGTVTFGGGDGKITGKGTIRTSKLNFENVYYVEELQNFNLFFVSQICDKKNKVLYTDTECLVLTKEFQLPENSQVVLRVPRRHNLYSFNLTEIQPERDITCLLEKASSDEPTE